MDKNEIYCPHCGHKIDKDLRFCPKCGVDLSTYKDDDVENSEEQIEDKKNALHSSKEDINLNSFPKREQHKEFQHTGLTGLSKQGKRKKFSLLETIIFVAVALVIGASGAYTWSNDIFPFNGDSTSTTAPSQKASSNSSNNNPAKKASSNKSNSSNSSSSNVVKSIHKSKPKFHDSFRDKIKNNKTVKHLLNDAEKEKKTGEKVFKVPVSNSQRSQIDTTWEDIEDNIQNQSINFDRSNFVGGDSNQSLRNLISWAKNVYKVDNDKDDLSDVDIKTYHYRRIAPNIFAFHVKYDFPLNETSNEENIAHDNGKDDHIQTFRWVAHVDNKGKIISMKSGLRPLHDYWQK